MKMRKGSSSSEGIATLIISAIVILCIIGGCWNKYINGNKQFIDLKQNFKVAYISYPDGKTERVEIETWKDWHESDAIQVVDRNGKVYYTHLNRVILSDR